MAVDKKGPMIKLKESIHVNRPLVKQPFLQIGKAFFSQVPTCRITLPTMPLSREHLCSVGTGMNSVKDSGQNPQEPYMANKLY